MLSPERYKKILAKNTHNVWRGLKISISVTLTPLSQPMCPFSSRSLVPQHILFSKNISFPSVAS